MSNIREAAQQALDALYRWHMTDGETVELMPAFEALRAALAEPVQEPVAWMDEHGHVDHGCDAILNPKGWTPLYSTPPQRKPLTEEEIRRIKPVSPDLVDFRSGVRCAERAHGIGGSDE